MSLRCIKHFEPDLFFFLIFKSIINKGTFRRITVEVHPRCYNINHHIIKKIGCISSSLTLMSLRCIIHTTSLPRYVVGYWICIQYFKVFVFYKNPYIGYICTLDTFFDKFWQVSTFLEDSMDVFYRTKGLKSIFN